jgi:hypothetical protein
MSAGRVRAVRGLLGAARSRSAPLLPLCAVYCRAGLGSLLGIRAVSRPRPEGSR